MMQEAWKRQQSLIDSISNIQVYTTVEDIRRVDANYSEVLDTRI